MERDGFVFYKSFYRAIQKIQDKEERLKAYESIVAYGIMWQEPDEDDWDAWMVFILVQPQIDANNKKYTDWCKWWRPKKDWDISQKPLVSEKITTGIENKKPKEKEKEKDKDKDKEKGYGEKQDANVTLDAEASRWNIKDAVGEKNKSMTLNEKLKDLWLEDEVIELAIVYNGCKKWKKLDKFKDAQLKIRVSKLRKCWFDSIEGMKQVLENSIAGWYEWIFELKTKPIPSSIPIQGWVVKVGNSNIFL